MDGPMDKMEETAYMRLMRGARSSVLQGKMTQQLNKFYGIAEAYRESNGDDTTGDRARQEVLDAATSNLMEMVADAKRELARRIGLANRRSG